MISAIRNVDSFKGNLQTQKTSTVLSSGVTKGLAADTAEFAGKSVRPSKLKSMVTAAALGISTLFGGTTLAGCDGAEAVNPTAPVVADTVAKTTSISAAAAAKLQNTSQVVYDNWVNTLGVPVEIQEDSTKSVAGRLSSKAATETAANTNFVKLSQVYDDQNIVDSASPTDSGTYKVKQTSTEVGGEKSYLNYDLSGDSSGNQKLIGTGWKTTLVKTKDRIMQIETGNGFSPDTSILKKGSIPGKVLIYDLAGNLGDSLTNVKLILKRVVK